MQVIAQTALMAASIVGGWEIVLMLAVVVTLLAAKRLPELAQGIRQFRRATREVQKELDGEADDAGKSLGGIYGKPAYEALTPDNQTAELYDPAVLRHEQKPDGGNQNAGLFYWRRLFRRIRSLLLNLLNWTKT